MTGFTNLVRTPAWLLLGGAGLAFAMGTVGATVVAWRVARMQPLVYLHHTQL